MTKQETIQALQSIEDRAVDFPNMTECDWVAIAAAKRHLQEELTSEDLKEKHAKQYDTVNHPSHYASGKIECIDAMEAAYGTEVVMHFCQCNALKYQWRFNKKNGDEDIQKAQWYQNKYLELENKLKAMNHFNN